MISFKLDDDFIEDYVEAPVNWGFLNEYSGVSLGELTFLSRYSRVKEDGTKERWYEVVRRVVEGCYSIQKDHCNSIGIEWDEAKGQSSAEEMYDLIFNFKFTPSGRGLWAMGTPLIHKHHIHAALWNCFSGDTSFITDTGAVRFKDVVGETVNVLAHNGEYEQAEVRHFGTQRLINVVLRPYGMRSNARLEYKATPNHRWKLADGSDTTELSVGDVVPMNPPKSDDQFVPEAFAHGLIFGDGEINKKYPHRHSIRLCSDRDKEYLPLLESLDGYVSTLNKDGDPYVTIVREGENWKELPYGKDTAYIDSFIHGWFTADAHYTDTAVKLDTIHREGAEWLKDNAIVAGYSFSGEHISTAPTNFGNRSAPLIRLSFSRKPVNYVVETIEPAGVEDVYCVVEPKTHTFTLSGGLLTGNCAFTSTRWIDDNPTEPFCYLMDLSMLGVGVGFDTEGDSKVLVDAPERRNDDYVYIVPDSREGWVESVRLLLEAYIYEDNVEFDYSLIRPYGEPIKTFGGTAPGPEPLKKLHNGLRDILNAKDGQVLTSRDIVDIMNLIGVCVVSGNVRRSAEIALGQPDDADFVHLKEYDRPENEYRAEFGWMSNNSIVVDGTGGVDYTRVADAIIKSNGEPGIFWIDNARRYGRSGEEKADYRVQGTNPCGEISLEHMELCNVVETYPSNHDSVEEYNRTLKYAYLYGKTLTLLNTHWKKTNAVMLRNRRIGISMSGVADFVDQHGTTMLRKMQRESYDTIQKYDDIYSEWLCIRNSIKTTTIKPSGTVSLLAGVSPGIHWPVAPIYIRRMIFDKSDKVLPVLEAAGYTIKESSFGGVFVEMPTVTKASRSDVDISLQEKYALLQNTQHDWADNSVSVSLYFDADTERDLLAQTLKACEQNGIKSISCFPQNPILHPERPYEQISYEDYLRISGGLKEVTFDAVYDGVNTADVAGDVFCTSDSCVI